ncbi:ATP-dependent helicase HrpB [Paenibacillus sp. 1P07SE]|uniref:ATP-dependent helicase HrpB n=1 Tax=Paenibacillus sp. 1P07SE TaxID=3132209 RepID=UPI0039A47BD4
MNYTSSGASGSRLPILDIIPRLQDVLRSGVNAVLAAPPGAGKTTHVPLALLAEPWLQGKKIIMLEPRRLAARSAARFMARSLGEEAGGRVGYRVRQDTKVGPHTVIEVVTEGILTRLLQDDPALEAYGIVIFDEYHERSLHADLGLALSLQSQLLLREDLRLLVMSATLDTAAVTRLLGDAPVVESAGRLYPVTTIHLDAPVTGPIEIAVADTAARAIREHAEGDVLVFLPGLPEIRRAQNRLDGLRLTGVHIAVLHGNLPMAAQDEAVKRHPDGLRKIILATSIAESSLTVEGVRIVVDSGWSRTSRFSPRTGMSRLETVRVALASANQRRGRAGRTGSGHCYRLWTVEEERLLEPAITPAIRQTDLAAVALELLVWGVREPSELSWLDPPPAAAYAQSLELLRELDAVDESGQLTAHGRRMSELPLHPRLAHLVLKGIALGHGELAIVMAALLQERDVLKAVGGRLSADLWLRLEAYNGKVAPGCECENSVLQRVRQEVRTLRRESGLESGEPASWDERVCGLLAAVAYPDRIAQRRSSGRYLLSSGRGAELPHVEPISASAYLAAIHLDDQGTDSRIILAAAVDEDDLRAHFRERITVHQEIVWQQEQQTIKSTEQQRLYSLLLRERPLTGPDPVRLAAVLGAAVRRYGLELLPWSRAHRQLLQRMRFMHKHESGWPDVTETALLDNVEDWLEPHLYGLRSRAELQRLPLSDILNGMLSWAQRITLQEQAPTHIRVPSGSSIPVDYDDPDAPAIAVRLQEIFGWQQTPRLSNGKIPLTLHLLSPARRPVQVTRDLASFWREAYFDVKKDLKGRYPKHYWPDDPLSATATSHAKPRN